MSNIGASLFCINVLVCVILSHTSLREMWQLQDHRCFPCNMRRASRLASKVMWQSWVPLQEATLSKSSEASPEATPEAGNVEKTQEDTPAEVSHASPEAGNVEKTQEGTTVASWKASPEARNVEKRSRRHTGGIFTS